MRICFICADGGIPVFGDKGGSVHVRAMVRAFARLGHEVTVLCAETGDGPPEFPVTAFGPDFPRAEDRAAKERRLIAVAQAIEERVVALHRERPFGLIYERYGLWSAAAVRASARTGCPAVVEVNAPLVQEQAAFRNFVLRDEAVAIEREVFSRATALAVVSRELCGYVTARGADPARVAVIGNAVDTAMFYPGIAPASVPGLAPGGFTVGFTGSLKAWHGTEVLIDAVARLAARRDVRLLIVGDGPDRAALEEQARTRGIADRMVITGWVPHHRLPTLIARMDVATAPYPAAGGHYFSPLKLYEYLAMGRPVVASDIGQTAALLRPSGAGVLVPPGDAAALADALERVAHDEGLAQRLGNLAARLGRGLDWTANAARVVRMARPKVAA